MTPPPVSETAAWTEQDEHEMLRYGVGTIPPFRTTGAHQDNAVRFAREILRLRADNERLTKDAERWHALAPLLYLDGDSWPDGKTARAWLCVTYREFPPESETPTDAVDSLIPTSRSRVSDNG